MKEFSRFTGDFRTFICSFRKTIVSLKSKKNSYGEILKQKMRVQKQQLN